MLFLAYKALTAAILGGILWLDRYQLFQMMFYRPIVSATLIGFVLGNLQLGLAIGILYELMWLGRPPIGGYIPPDSGFAAMAGSAIAVIGYDTSSAILTVAFLVFLSTLPLAFLGSRLDEYLRSKLEQLAQDAEKNILSDNRVSMGPVFMKAILFGFLLSALALFPIIIIGVLILKAVLPHISADLSNAMSFGYYIIPIFLALEMVYELYETRLIILFFIGLISSIVAGWYVLS